MRSEEKRGILFCNHYYIILYSSPQSVCFFKMFLVF